VRVLLLADPNLAHTIKWARSLAEMGLEISIFGLPNFNQAPYLNHKNIQALSLGLDASIAGTNRTKLAKLRYLLAVPRVKNFIAEYKPDILHAHYASSYGLIGALTGFHPYVLSVWGADIFEFPRKSFLHKAIVEFNLKRADTILSTSEMMVDEIKKYTEKEIQVTPFGIDLDYFKPQTVSSLFKTHDIVIGTVKALEEQYGIEFLIRAFKILKEKHPHLPLKLLIVGGGSLESALKSLVKELRLVEHTVFTGRVSYDQVLRYHNMISVYVALSIIDSESFGVAILEASACEKPVVVSKVGGLPEVVENGVTGFVVPPQQPEAAAAKIEKLVLDKELRVKMGQAGRERVTKLYRWTENVKQMISIYQKHSVTNKLN
jgi:L-malate glycosyltransferase